MSEILVHLDKNLYQLAVEASSNRWSNTKKGGYGKGILNSKSDKYKTERIGLLGELAFAKLFNLKVDLDYKHGGDKFDFLISEKTYDIKTSSKRPLYEQGLIMRVTENGKLIEIDKDYYVFGYLKEENLQALWAEVVFIGYQTKEFIEKLTIVPPKVEYLKHKNVEVNYSDMLDLKELF